MSDRVLFVDQKLKRKMEDPPSSETTLEELLTLRLGYNNTSKLLKSSEVSGSSSPKHVEEGQYSCKYCNMKFLSFQDLGGHQHGRKHRKTLLEWGRDLSLKPYEIKSHTPMKNPQVQFKSPLTLLSYATLLDRFRNRGDMPSWSLGRGSYANHAPNTSFIGPPQFAQMNRLQGGGVSGIPQRLNQQNVNQVPPFVGAPISSAPLEGLKEEELNLSLTL